MTNIDVLAVPEDKKSEISITGNNDLQMENNVILVTVTAENGEQKTYTINAVRSNKANLINSKLENLAIENTILVPDFNPNVFDYTAEIENNVNSLNILAVPQIEKATVSIVGNENLQFGENEIIVTVKSENGESVNKYNNNFEKPKCIYFTYEGKEGYFEYTDDYKTLSEAYNEAKRLKQENKAKKSDDVIFAAILTTGTIVSIGSLIKTYLKGKEK